MLDEIKSKTMHSNEEGDQKRKRNQDTEWSKASQKHKFAEFFRDKSCEKEILLSHELQDHVYEKESLFGLKDNPSQRNCHELSHPSLSHIEQECQESLIDRKICI